MHVADLLSPEDITLGLGATSPKDLLRQLARRLEPRAQIASAEIYRALHERELIGPTSVKGVMLPHAPMDNLLRPAATFAQLRRPLDCNAHDGEDVHFAFALLWPADDMRGLLQGLVCVCRSLREQAVRERLLRARTKEEIFIILEGSHSAVMVDRRSDASDRSRSDGRAGWVETGMLNQRRSENAQCKETVSTATTDFHDDAPIQPWVKDERKSIRSTLDLQPTADRDRDGAIPVRRVP